MRRPPQHPYKRDEGRGKDEDEDTDDKEENGQEHPEDDDEDLPTITTAITSPSGIGTNTASTVSSTIATNSNKADTTAPTTDLIASSSAGFLTLTDPSSSDPGSTTLMEDSSTTSLLSATTDDVPTSTAIPVGDSQGDQTGEQASIVADDGGHMGYGHAVTVIYCLVIAILALAALVKLHGLKGKPGSSPSPTTLQKATAVFRLASYRRFAPPLLGSINAGVVAIVATSWVVGLAMALGERPLYNGTQAPPVGVRTGLMALALMPLIWALSGKVSFVTFLTGHGYERLNVFHRQLSYLAFFFTFIHVVAFLIAPQRDGVGFDGLKERFDAASSPWFTGVPTTFLFALLLFFSLPPLRKHAYEFFALSHILLSIVLLGLLYWHIPARYWPWLHATLVLWVLQILLRALLKTRRARAFVSVGGTGQEEMVRVVVGPPVGGVLRWRAGEHVFLRFPGLARPWENHPFAVASAVGGLPAAVGGVGRGASPWAAGGQGALMEGNWEMLFLIKARSGMTGRLAGVAPPSGDAVEVPVLVDGPYGGFVEDLATRYEGVVLVAGGSGIGGVLAVFEVLSRATAGGVGAGEESSSSTGATGTPIRRVDLVWVVSHREKLDWAQERIRLIQQSAAPGVVGVQTYVSCPAPEIPSDVDSERGILGSRGDSSRGERVKAAIKILRDKSRSASGRGVGSPSMGDLVPRLLLKEARSCVIACGPASLVHDTSNAVAAAQSRVLRGEYQEVSFRGHAWE